MTTVSPIARKQRLLYPQAHPLAPLRGALRQARQRGYGFGYFGLTGSASGAAQGASTGASVGSVFPVIGTAIGAILGAVGGSIAGSLNKRDPEQRNFDQAVALWQQNRLAVLNMANKYLPLAGLFDLDIHTNIPIYKKYGRMGEQRFVTDLMTKIYQAARSGQITAGDTPQTIMARIVQPWIDSWGFGPMADPHADLINLLIMGMIADYVAGMQGNWTAIGGDYPFTDLPKFTLQSVATSPSPSAAAQPPGSPVTNPAVPATVLSADGSVAKPGSNTAIRAQGHTFYFGSAAGAGGTAVYIDGQWDGTGGGTGLGLLNGQVYLQNNQGNWYQWTANGWTGTSAPAGGSPAGGGSQNAPAIPTTLLTADGSSTTPGAGTGIRGQGHTFYFGTAPGAGGTAVYIDGAWDGTGGGTVLGLLNGGQVYLQNNPGNWYQWTANGWTGLSSAPVQSPAAPPAGGTVQNLPAPLQTTVAVPAGFNPVGQANGMAAYQGPNAAVYSWNGATMTPLTGVLTDTSGAQWTVNGGVVQNSSALPAPSLTSAQQQLYNTATAPYYAPTPASVPAQPGPGTAAAQPSGGTPQAAGIAGLPSWVTWSGIGAVVLVMFATARPHGKVRMPRGRRS